MGHDSVTATIMWFNSMWRSNNRIYRNCFSAISLCAYVAMPCELNRCAPVLHIESDRKYEIKVRKWKRNWTHKFKWHEMKFMYKIYLDVMHRTANKDTNLSESDRIEQWQQHLFKRWQISNIDMRINCSCSIGRSSATQYIMCIHTIQIYIYI